MTERNSDIIVANGELEWSPDLSRPEGIVGIAVISGDCSLFLLQHRTMLEPNSCWFVRSQALDAVRSDSVQAVLWYVESIDDVALTMDVALPLGEVETTIVYDVFCENARPVAHQRVALQLLVHQLADLTPQRPQPGEGGEELAARIGRYLAEHLDEPLSLDRLTDAFDCSKAQLLRNYRAAVGKSPMRHLAELRLMRARDLLLQTELSISQIAHAVGYTALPSFTHFFQRHEGRSPSQYRDDCRWLV